MRLVSSKFAALFYVYSHERDGVAAFLSLILGVALSFALGLALLTMGESPAKAISARKPDALQETRPGPQPPAASPGVSGIPPSISPAGVAFEPIRRAVSNWRTEAVDNLDLSEAAKTKLAGETGLVDVPRCVKLNNYWCIKRARWAGEIAADAENHVAFASAIDGAIAAAMLLRRYYVDYNRHSALAILSRWAPAQCAAGAAAQAGPIGMPLKHRAAAARFASLQSDAPHGIQNTLRARWLAARTKTLRRSVVRSWPLAMMQAPEIAVGMGEPKHPPIPAMKIAALDFATPAPAPPGVPCASENTRIQNYASRAIEGIAASPNDDLTLFLADGSASANLPRLLDNMAKVEIGPMTARASLIAAAIERLSPRSVAAGTPPPAGPLGGASRSGE
jgi:hypothetical protein